MPDQVPTYAIAEIRGLLLAAFTAEELRRFLQDRPTFRPIVDQIGPGYGLDDMVDEVVEYCERRLLLDELLEEVKGYNPSQYARFEERLRYQPTEAGVDPRLQEAQKLLADGREALQAGEHRRGLDLLQRSYGLFELAGAVDGMASSLLYQGIQAREEGDADRALELAQRALELYRQAGDRQGEALSLFAVGRTAQVRGDYGAAENHYRDSRKLFEDLGNDEHVALNSLHLGQIAFAQGNYTWAEEELRRAIELDAENAAAHNWLGQTYARRGEYDMALSSLGRAIELDPNDASAFAQRGELYRQREEYPKALEDLDRALDLEPEDARVLARRGDTHRLLGDLDAAYADLMASYQLDPEDAWMLAHRGETLRQMGNYESARRDFDAALHHNPDDTWALALRGETYRQMDQFEEALADLNRAVERSPNDAWILARRGETYRQMEEYEKALADFDKALELKPDDAWTLAHRGEAYRQMAGDEASDQQPVEAAESAAEGAVPPDRETQTADQVEVSEERPTDPVDQAQQLLDEGRMAEEKGDYDAAYERYEKSHTIFSREGDREGLATSALGLGRAALPRGLPEQAKEHFEEAQKEFQWLRDRQGLAESLLGLGQAARSLNDLGQAKKYLKRAQKYFEELGDQLHLAETTLVLGWLAVGDGDMAQAGTYASQADSLYPALRDNLGEEAPATLAIMGRELAEIWLEAGRWALYDGELEPARKRLVASLERFQELDDLAGQAQSLHLLGRVHLEQGDLDAAEKDLKESRDLCGKLQSSAGGDPSGAGEFAAGVTDNLFYLARVDLARGDLDWALQGFNDVLAREPQRAEAYAWRSEAYYMMPDLPAALDDLNRALELDATDAWAWARRGLVRREMGDKEGALEDLDRALELNPEDTWAREQREELLKGMPAPPGEGEEIGPEPVESEEVAPGEKEAGEPPEASPEQAPGAEVERESGPPSVLPGDEKAADATAGTPVDTAEQPPAESIHLSVDAAVPERVQVGQEFTLAVYVRHPGLPRVVFGVRDTVRSRHFYPGWRDGQQFVDLRLEVSAPDCDLHGKDTEPFRLPRTGSQPPLLFTLTPTRQGVIPIVIKVYQRDEWLGSTLVPTEAQAEEVGDVELRVFSGPLRMWLVVGKTGDKWDRFFASFAKNPDQDPIHWTEVKHGPSQHRLKKAREGDHVLAYASVRPVSYITGLGRIASDPYDHEDRQAVDIHLVQQFPEGVDLKMLRAEVPGLEKVRVDQINFSPVAPEEWDVIRRLILSQNPGAGLEDVLPEAVTEVRRPEEEEDRGAEEEEVPPGPEPSAVEPSPEEAVNLQVDAALPERVKVGDPFEIAFSVRRPDQLALDLAGLSQPEAGDPPPEPGDGALRLELSAPECELDGAAARAFRLQPAEDPPRFHFRLTPKGPGVIPVIVRVYEQDTLSSKTSLYTLAYEEEVGKGESKQVSPPMSARPEVMVWQGHDNPPPTPPWSDDWITIEVDMATVTLTTSDGARYRSKNKLDHDRLKLERALPPEDVGHLLFKGLINADGSEPGFKHRPTCKGYEHALVAANDGPLRIMLDVRPDHPNYTWEYLKDPSMDLPLALREKAPFFRLYSSAGKAPVQATPIRILFAICNPRTLRRPGEQALDGGDPVLSGLIGLNVALERGTIAKARAKLVGLGGQSLAQCDIMERSETGPVTLAAIRDALKARQYHVLHLLAHGTFVENREKYALVMEDKNGDDALVYADSFDETLAAYGLRLVVLAACDSAAAGVGPALKALAPRLIETGVPAVIAMQRWVPVTTAQAFTQQFYGDLARTGRVDMALAATRYELYLRDQRGGAWAIPLLMMSRHDGQLFKVDERRASTLSRPLSRDLDVQDYGELGVEDPTPQKVTRAVEQQLQAYGYGRDRMLSHAVRAVLAPGLASRPPEAEALASKQDRDALVDLAKGVCLEASELQAAVEADSQLEVPNGTYDQIASALNAGKHIILIGPPGTGKTTLAQSVCRCAVKRKITPGFVLTTATADWTTFDTVGGYVPTQEGSLQFRPGIFLEAVSDGKWLIIDEINRAEIDKAFGELFTVLSGQRVDLPYKVKGQEVSIMPPARKGEGQAAVPWAPRDAFSPYHYVMHPNWRIIGTMNVYDKSTLFQLSHAFMRRFAFIDLDPPQDAGFFHLVDRWLVGQGIDACPPPEPVRDLDGRALRGGAEWGDCKPMQRHFRRLLHRVLEPGTELDGENPLMQRRALGPAMVKDMIEYIGDRWKFVPQASREQQVPKLMGEAFLLYVLPQLDGLDYEGIIDIHEHIQGLFKEKEAETVLLQILRRIELLYPHIHDWRKIGQQSATETKGWE